MVSWTVRILSWDALTGTPWRERLRAEVDRAVAEVAGSGQVVVDERCPGLDAETVRAMLREATDGRPRVGTRPVTDTVKRVVDGVVTGTVERVGLVQLTGPLVLPDGEIALAGSFEATVAELAASTEVVRVEVPAAARRLVDESELALLPLSR